MSIAGPRAAGVRLLDDRFEAVGIFADAQLAKLIDRAFEGPGQRAAVKADPNPLDTAIGAEGKDHDRPRRLGIFQRRGERIVFRNVEDLGAKGGELHR
jgi:hypothetical protein